MEYKNIKIIDKNKVEMKNIIQTYKTNDIPSQYKPLVEKVKKLNPDWNYLYFTDEDIIYFIKNKTPEYYETFLNLRYKIQQIDFFRYLAIYHYGGLYLDLDMDIVKNFDDLDQTKAIFPVETRDPETGNILVGNYAFYAPAFHPFVGHIINCIVNPIVTESEIAAAQKGHGDPKEHVYVYFTTGPELVTKAYHSYTGNKNDVVLLEPEGEYRKDCFGSYGHHKSFGTWKS
jgi:mannosyltransferase OCH1-like enzyme